MRRHPVLAAFAILLLPTCGSAGETPPTAGPSDVPPGDAAGAERMVTAPAATMAAVTARTASTTTFTGVAGLPRPAVLHGTGAVDFATGRAVSNVDLSDLLPEEADAEVRRLETRFLDGITLVRSPVLNALAGISTPWMRISPQTTLGIGVDLTSLTGGPGSDGTAMLALLAGVERESVRDHGRAPVGGEMTSRLSATVDLPTAVERAGALTDGDRFERLTTALGARQLAVDAFVDDAGRLRRLAYEHRLPPQGGGGTVRTELELFDFGAPVDVVAPPEDQVTDLRPGHRR